MNKIIVSIILAVILVLGINKITDVIFHVEKPEKSAYQIASTSTTTTTETTSASSSSGSGEIMTLLASASIADGKKIFKKCAACHSIAKDGGHKIGPALWGEKLVQFLTIDILKQWSLTEKHGHLKK